MDVTLPKQTAGAVDLFPGFPHSPSLPPVFVRVKAVRKHGQPGELRFRRCRRGIGKIEEELAA